MTNGSIVTRKMIFQLFTISLLINIVFSMPVTKTRYDQTQSGTTNVRADLENILILFLPSGGVRFLDSSQIDNIVQLVAGSRRNPSETSTVSGSDAFKAAIEQAAIDKLHSDVDSLNSIIPISKNYNSNNDNAERKEIIDEAPENVKKEEPITTPSDDKREPEIAPDNKKEEVAILITTEKASPEPQNPVIVVVTSPEKTILEEAKLSTSASPEITTSESVITSIPLLKSPEKDKPVKIVPNSDVTGDKQKPLDDLSTKLHQRVIEPSTPVKSQVRSSSPAQQTKSSAPTTSSSKTAKVLTTEEKQQERQLKALQSGLVHCLPGQRLTENGNCVEIPSVRESRQQKMERLLSLLRFGVQPASNV